MENHLVASKPLLGGVEASLELVRAGLGDAFDTRAAVQLRVDLRVAEARAMHQKADARTVLLS